MSVIIRLQNLPWSANALDIRNYFRGLSIPEGGVHIVGGELGDAFIAFSTDEDARQGMMLDGGKIKEIQVKLLLSSRSEMHKVIESARQTVPLLSMPLPTPAPAAPAPIPAPPPAMTPFAAALASSAPGLAAFGIPGIGNPLEIPQPAVIEPPAPLSLSPTLIITPNDDNDVEEETKKRDRRRTRSQSRDKKERKRDRRDRSRSRDRRRRDRSRSRDRKDRRRKDRSRSKDRNRDISPVRRSGRDDRRTDSRQPGLGLGGKRQSADMSPSANDSPRFDADTVSRLHELNKRRNPAAFNAPDSDARPFNGANNNLPPRGNQRGFGPTGNGNRPDTEHTPTFDMDRGCCVAIRNAPNHTSYGDVRRFFPFLIDKHGIKMINDDLGRRTGNILVRFCDARSRSLALQRRSNELKGQEVIVEHCDEEAYAAAVDSFLPFRREEEVEEEQHRVLRLDDLPFYVKEHDIMKAFADYSLLSITLTDCRATRTKVAHVQFAKPEEARAAFDSRERLVFGRRPVNVTSLSDAEWERVRGSPPPAPVLQGGPPSQPALLPPPPGVVAPPTRDPRQRRAEPAPPAPYLSPFAPNNAILPPQQQFVPFQQPPAPRFGGFPQQPMAQFVHQNGDGNQPGSVPPVDEELLDCVLMKGLPRNASDRTIVEFLADTGAVPSRIHLMLDPDGQPSGDCFCEFRSEGEARRATGKHGRELTGCRVTVDPVPRSVVEDALEGPKPAPPPEPALLPSPVFFEAMRGGMGPNTRGVGGPPFRGHGGFPRGGFNRGGGAISDDFNGGFGRGGMAGFPRANGIPGGFEQEGGGFAPRGRGGLRGRGGFDHGGGRGFDRGGGRGFDRGGRGRGGMGRGFGGGGGFDEKPMMADEKDPVEEFGAPGCVVSMENVPFRATVDEILQFFSEFELTQDDVIRRFNERGQPTGDARVAFRTPFDAQRAVKTHHMETIHDRRITLNML